MKSEERAREPRGKTPGFYRVGDLLVDIGRARVTRNGTEIPLPKLSFDLLLALMHAAPNLVSTDELMTRVWPGLVVNLETVSQRVKLLRDALGDRSKDPRYIAAVRGRGYRLLAEVESLEAMPSPVRSSASASRVAARPVWIVIAAGVSVLLAVVAMILWRSGIHQATEQTTSNRVTVSAAPMRSVAVLPFENLSTEPNSAVLTMGIAESVLHQLATHEQLMVIARTSSFAFAGRNVDAREVGRALNARYLLEGSVQSGQGRLRVIAQLIDSTTGVHVWSMRFDRTPENLFALQDEIASAVARELEASVTVSAIDKAAKRDTQSLDAWIAYQQGRALAATRKKPDLEQAKVRFGEAIRYDPAFASAYVALAETRLLLSLFATSDSWLSAHPRAASEQEAKEVEALLARAIDLNPQDGHAYVVRAWIQETPPRAEEDYRRGLLLNPNDATGYERFSKELYFFPGPNGEFYDPQKRDEAFEMIDRARELDPLNPNAHITKALMTLYGRSNVEEANELLLQALAVEPNYYPALMRLAELRWCCQGEPAEGIKFGEQALALAPQAAWPRHFLTYMYLDLGDARAAQSVVEEGGDDPVLQMIVHLSRGEWREAGELAYTDLNTLVGVDKPLLMPTILLHAMATGDTERAQRALQEWSGVTWSSRGEPQVDDTHLGFDAHIALAQVLQISGDEARSKRLLERVLVAMDRQATTLRRGNQWFSTDRPKVLALLGRKEEALRGLELAFAANSMINGWFDVKANPAFNGIRKEPRFRAVLNAWEARMHAQRQKLEAMRAAGVVPRREPSSKLVEDPH